MVASRRVTFLIALLVFLVAATVYFVTLTPTVPFWDAGEFIACSFILGIPHPPGTPLYVLLGRVATLIPWETVAQRVNGLSALSSALTVMLTYLTGLKFIRLAQGGNRSGVQEWIAHVGAVTGALMFAFSDSFWENSIEAEVYALMSLAQILVLWLGLKWWEEHERRPTAGPLLLAVYVMWLSVGFHLGVGIMGLPLMVLVCLVDWRVGIVFGMPFVAVLLVPRGLESLVGGVLVLCNAAFIVYAAQKKLNGWVALASAVVALYCFGIAWGDASFTPWTASLAVASVLVPLVMLALRAREGRILALALSLMVVGYSTHLYLPIRAAQHPAINEGNPSNWGNLRDLLERRQYGQMNMFERRAPLLVQLDKEFWRYFSRQWPLAKDSAPLLPGLYDDRADREGFEGDWWRPLLWFLVLLPARTPWGALLPLLLGLAGGIWQMRREKISFLYAGCFLGATTVGMIVFLNFSPSEVRERDYFFQSGFHAYALWIGLGVAWVADWVRESFSDANAQAYAGIATAALLACMPFLMLVSLWYTHDRRGNYVARDYAYNMLAPLKQDSFMFTNGDNDTFPLWYIQEVEGLRKDVRVVNLSLLNTDWYIQQLRDEPARVPVHLDDSTIRALGMGAVRDEATGRVIYTNEFMVNHIIKTAESGTGWSMQPYFAVTVPEHYGYDRHFSLEGLVYRVNRDTLQDPVDEPATRHAMYGVFRYKGLFRADGSWDSTVYKDENAATLSRNYAAAHIQLAFWYRRHGDGPKAIAEMERVERMFPDYTDVLVQLGSFYMEQGETARALGLFRRLVSRNAGDPEVHYYYGVALVYQRQVEDAVREFNEALRLDPGYAQAYYAAYYTLWEAGRRERALAYLERWSGAHPEDAQAREMLDSGRRLLGQGEVSRPVMPRPPVPDLP